MCFNLPTRTHTIIVCSHSFFCRVPFLQTFDSWHEKTLGRSFDGILLHVCKPLYDLTKCLDRLREAILTCEPFKARRALLEFVTQSSHPEKTQEQRHRSVFSLILQSFEHKILMLAISAFRTHNWNIIASIFDGFLAAPPVTPPSAPNTVPPPSVVSSAGVKRVLEAARIAIGQELTDEFGETWKFESGVSLEEKPHHDPRPEESGVDIVLTRPFDEEVLLQESERKTRLSFFHKAAHSAIGFLKKHNDAPTGRILYTQRTLRMLSATSVDDVWMTHDPSVHERGVNARLWLRPTNRDHLSDLFERCNESERLPEMLSTNPPNPTVAITTAATATFDFTKSVCCTTDGKIDGDIDASHPLFAPHGHLIEITRRDGRSAVNVIRAADDRMHFYIRSWQQQSSPPTLPPPTPPPLPPPQPPPPQLPSVMSFINGPRVEVDGEMEDEPDDNVNTSDEESTRAMDVDADEADRADRADRSAGTIGAVGAVSHSLPFESLPAISNFTNILLKTRQCIRCKCQAEILHGEDICARCIVNPNYQEGIRRMLGGMPLFAVRTTTAEDDRNGNADRNGHGRISIGQDVHQECSRRNRDVQLTLAQLISPDCPVAIDPITGTQHFTYDSSVREPTVDEIANGALSIDEQEEWRKKEVEDRESWENDIPEPTPIRERVGTMPDLTKPFRLKQILYDENGQPSEEIDKDYTVDNVVDGNIFHIYCFGCGSGKSHRMYELLKHVKERRPSLPMLVISSRIVHAGEMHANLKDMGFLLYNDRDRDVKMADDLKRKLEANATAENTPREEGPFRIICSLQSYMGMGKSLLTELEIRGAFIFYDEVTFLFLLSCGCHAHDTRNDGCLTV